MKSSLSNHISEEHEEKKENADISENLDTQENTSYNNGELQPVNPHFYPQNSTDLQQQPTFHQFRFYDVRNSPIYDVKMPISSRNQKHECPVCGLAFLVYTSLAHHISTDHMTNYLDEQNNVQIYRNLEDKPYKCSKCEQKFSDRSQIMKHLAEHDISIQN